jgi:copper chaperone CopZ
MTTQLMATQQLTLPIRGMTCVGCVASVQLALSDLPGVHEAEVDLSTKQARVTYDPTVINQPQMVEAVVEAGYQVEEEAPPTLQPASAQATHHPWRWPVFFGLLGMASLLALYLGLVSLAEGWVHAVELLLEDAWLVGPILAGFGVQMGLYTYLKTVIHAAARGTGALAGAGGGTSTAAMVACCAHHVTDVLPLLGLSAAATFLAEYRTPFMLVGLATNLIGIGVIGYLIVRQRRRLAECELEGHHAATTASAATCH